jgi:SAM-dependent methyltransferase
MVSSTFMDAEAEWRALAGVAEEHARREHRSPLDEGGEGADRILRAEAGAGPGRIESLAACYGAWIGEQAVRRWGAFWTGFSEPVSPRLRIGGSLASPVDAARRRLSDPFARTIPSVLRELERLAEPGVDVLGTNRAAWDALAADPHFAGPLPLPENPESALDAWVRDEGIRGKDLLCLGGGGGRQGPLHAAAGARVTVVDLSERQLDHDRRAGLRAVCASIDRLEGIPDAAFDVVVQPVSACYVPDVRAVYAEVARVLRPGGLYVVQHKQPGFKEREPGAREFRHSLEDLLGGLCSAGFVIEAFSEPPRGDVLAPPGTGERRAAERPPYLKLKARRLPRP